MTQDKLQYRGYAGSIEYSEEDFVFFGKLLDIPDLVSYHGYTSSELTSAFIDAVDDYIVTIEVINKF